MIKFRAWDKKAKEYFHISELWNSGTNPECFNFDGWTDNFGNKGRLKDIVIEQFTGLTDVNGKEIYEGDILRLSRDEPKTYIYDDKDNLKPKIIMPKTVTETAPVTKDTGTFGVSVKGVFLTLREVDKGQQNIEVIGNVHTNPELLEKKK